MEIQVNKCFSVEHKDIEAKTYCPNCQIFMCNKCESLHSKLFKNHISINLDENKEEIFTDYCKEKDHHMKLEFFCKNHNQLCCAVCIAKLQKNEIGKHKDCDICFIEDIIDEKKNKLNENIKILEELSNSLEDIINNLKLLMK